MDVCGCLNLSTDYIMSYYAFGFTLSNATDINPRSMSYCLVINCYIPIPYLQQEFSCLDKNDSCKESNVHNTQNNISSCRKKSLPNQKYPLCSENNIIRLKECIIIHIHPWFEMPMVGYMLFVDSLSLRPRGPFLDGGCGHQPYTTRLVRRPAIYTATQS